MCPRSFKASLLIKGLSGIVAQVLLMRELLVSFHGNELTLGIIFANWLILTAVGSFALGKTVEITEEKIEVFVLFQLFFSLALPGTLFLSRIFKNILLFMPGEELGLIPVFYSSLLILLPVTLPQGALFTYGCRLYSQQVTKGASSIGKVYALETIGTILGGLLMTFLLIQFLNSFQIAFVISLANTLISIFLLSPRAGSPPSAFRRALWILSLSLSFVFCYSLLPHISSAMNQSSLRSQWRNLNVIHNENSVYQNITVTERGEQTTFFANGVPSITTPVPDIASVEDFVHFPMLFHEKPQSVLVLSGGVGGMIHEILKYPVKRVDYVELDPLLLKLVQRFSTPLTRSELLDPRVRIHDMDGRFFVRQTRDRFDLIFIGLPAPQELQANRLFSTEFFSIVREKMSPDGIMVLALPGSLTYISPELRDLNRCISDTLKTAFRSIRIIPGDTNLYLASNGGKLDEVTQRELIKRLEERKVQTNLFTKSYLEFRLHDRWMKWFQESMEKNGIQINSDFRPIAVFLSLSYWNALFFPSATKIFRGLEGFRLPVLIGWMTLFTILMAVLFIKRPLYTRYSIPYAIFTTGLTGMIFNLAVIFTFQTLYGYVYHQIGLLIAVFMSGVALASFCVTRYLDRMKKDSLLFLKIELAIILFSLIFPFAFSIPFPSLERTAPSFLIYPVFLIISFFSGAWIGLQFPLASKIYLATPGRDGILSDTAGRLYAADLLGGFLGGLLGGVLLLPILGLKESCFMMAIIKLSSLALFFMFIKGQKVKCG